MDDNSSYWANMKNYIQQEILDFRSELDAFSVKRMQMERKLEQVIQQPLLDRSWLRLIGSWWCIIAWPDRLLLRDMVEWGKAGSIAPLNAGFCTNIAVAFSPIPQVNRLHTLGVRHIHELHSVLLMLFCHHGRWLTKLTRLMDLQGPGKKDKIRY